MGTYDTRGGSAASPEMPDECCDVCHLDPADCTCPEQQDPPAAPAQPVACDCHAKHAGWCATVPYRERTNKPTERDLAWAASPESQGPQEAKVAQGPPQDDRAAELAAYAMTTHPDDDYLRVHAAIAAAPAQDVGEALKPAVDRFLAWKLPADFHPDCGISFEPDYNQHTPWPAKHEPVGTNLLTAEQARAMLEHCVGPELTRLRAALADVREDAEIEKELHFDTKDRLRQAYADLDAANARADAAEKAKNGAYLERNQVVAALARMVIAMGERAGIARTAIDGWSEDWHGCVYMDLPTGQASWHYHDSQAHLFDWLPPYSGKWDGHTTPEKYQRLDAMCRSKP